MSIILFVSLVSFSLFSLILATIFAIKYIKLSHKTKNLFDKICTNVDSLIADNTIKESILYTEEYSSKIHFKLLRLQEILHENKTVLEKEKKILQEFISDTAHQVKTPMANLKMIHETVCNTNLSRTEKEEMIKSSKSQLLKLEFILDALIKSSRLETGMVQLSKQKYSAKDILSEVITLALPLLTQKEQEIRLEEINTLEILVDKKWLIECLFNIVENASKYSSEKSTITITTTKNEMYSVISIQDEGIGIKECDFGAIFSRFYRGENVTTQEGVGIGLHLAREIITLHEGYISVQSSVGKGSCFNIHLQN